MGLNLCDNLALEKFKRREFVLLQDFECELQNTSFPFRQLNKTASNKSLILVL